MKEDSSRTQLWSSGGGVQSAAIAALIVSGKVNPPDLAVIVDTERELSTTWKYMDEVITPALKSVGVVLHRIPKSRYATVDLMRNDDILIPAFTTAGAGVGKLPTYCSNEWKQRVTRRWASEQVGGSFDVWLGFSIDEMKRVTIPVGKWQHRYPLIEKRLSRDGCMALVASMGWPEPPRSSCWMCPNKSPSEWKWQKSNAIDDFEMAVAFEKEIQKRDPDLWLTQNAIPIDQVDFDDGNLDLFGSCSGGCFT